MSQSNDIDRVEFLLGFARTYMKHGQLDNAICAYTNVLVLDPRNKEAIEKLREITGMRYLGKATGHSDQVFKAVWLNDGIHIASGGADNMILVWNSHNGKIVRVFGDHRTHITALSRNPKELIIASGSEDGTIVVYDVVSCRREILDRHRSKVNFVLWSSDGKKLISGDNDGKVVFWDTTTFEAICEVDGHPSPVIGAVWSPGNRYILTFSREGTISVYNPQTGKIIYRLRDPSGAISSVDWSPDCSRIVSGSYDGKIRIFDLKLVRTRILGEHKHIVSHVFWRKNDIIVSVGWDGKIISWDPQTMERIAEVGRHTTPIIHAELTKNERYLATSSLDKTIGVWDLEKSTEIVTLRGHKQLISNINWNPRKNLLLSVSWDATIIIWDPLKKIQKRMIHKSIKRMTAITWDVDSGRIIAGYSDGSLAIYDMETMKIIDTARIHEGKIASISVLEGSSIIATGSMDSTVAVIDISEGDITVKAHRPVSALGINCVRFSPSGEHLLVCSDDGIIRLLDLDCNVLREYRGHIAVVSDVAWNKDSTMFASASWDGTVRIWKKDSDSEYMLLKYDKKLTAIDWNPRVDYISFGTQDGTVYVWNLAQGKEYMHSSPHRDAVVSLQWSFDGVLLASGGEDGSIFIFNIVRKQQEEYRLPAPISDLTWDHTFKRILAGCRNGDIIILDKI